MADRTTEVAVIGGTPGGIATAVRATREGHDVVLVTYQGYLGGMMAGGLSYTDTLTMKARSPVLEEFVSAVRTHYRTTYGEDSKQYEYCENGYVFEPHVASETFERLVDGEPGMTVLREYRPTSVQRANRRIAEVTLESVDGNETIAVGADVFVEATYEGDLMAAAGIPYRTGREARSEHDEQFAGRIFTGARGDRYYPRDAVGEAGDSAPAERRGPLDVPPEQRRGRLDLIPHPAGLTEIYPGSTGEGDGAIQAYNYRLCLSRDPENRRPPEVPDEYDREEYLDALDEVTEAGLRSYLLLRYLPNEKADMNAADLPGENHDYPEADWNRRSEIAERHRTYALGLLYFLQNDDAVPAAIRDEAREWGLAADEFTDSRNFPSQLYVREARRLDGRYTFTENDARVAPGLDRTPVHDDAIAIAEYPLDSHACHEERQVGSQPEGFFYASQVTRPSQVPYRALLPRGVDNLLVPVPLSATHVGYGTIRVEPTWMHVGEAAGFAASHALDADVLPADADVAALQRRLVANGLMISFFNEFDMATDEPWVEAVQYLGTRGLFDSYDAEPEADLDQRTAGAWATTAGAIVSTEGTDPSADRVDPSADGINPTDRARRLPTSEGTPISAESFAGLLEAETGAHPEDALEAVDVDREAPVSRGDACRMIYRLVE